MKPDIRTIVTVPQSLYHTFPCLYSGCAGAHTSRLRPVTILASARTMSSAVLLRITLNRGCDGVSIGSDRIVTAVSRDGGAARDGLIQLGDLIFEDQSLPSSRCEISLLRHDQALVTVLHDHQMLLPRAQTDAEGSTPCFRLLKHPLNCAHSDDGCNFGLETAGQRVCGLSGRASSDGWLKVGDLVTHLNGSYIQGGNLSSALATATPSPMQVLTILRRCIEHDRPATALPAPSTVTISPNAQLNSDTTAPAASKTAIVEPCLTRNIEEEDTKLHVVHASCQTCNSADDVPLGTAMQTADGSCSAILASAGTVAAALAEPFEPLDPMRGLWCDMPSCATTICPPLVPRPSDSGETYDPQSGTWCDLPEATTPAHEVQVPQRKRLQERKTWSDIPEGETGTGTASPTDTRSEPQIMLF